MSSLSPVRENNCPAGGDERSLALGYIDTGAEWNVPQNAGWFDLG